MLRWKDTEIGYKKRNKRAQLFVVARYGLCKDNIIKDILINEKQIKQKKIINRAYIKQIISIKIHKDKKQEELK